MSEKIIMDNNSTKQGQRTKLNLSFAGCGFLGIYHVGVAVCFKKYAPHLLLNKISGASAGAIAACCLLCDLPIGEVASDMLGLIREARLRTLGPFSPSFNVQEFLLERLRNVLPEDAHLRVNGKLHISLTRVYDGKNVIVSHFTSKDDLLQALLASAFVPIFSGFIPPKFHNERYMDGGFSDNLPTLDENTITVSPFCGETDICPRDYSSQLFHVNVANTSIELSKQNMYRFARILWPPKPEVLANMCKQGFDDALRFLHRNNLINCTKCLAVQSTYIVSEAVEETFEYDPQCQECKLHRQEALVANLPDTVVRVFQEAIDSANKGLYNWMLSHRGMKLITILSLPYTVPADFALAGVKKIISVAPHMKSNLAALTRFFIEQLSHVIKSVGTKSHSKHSIDCRLDYAGLGYDNLKLDQDMNVKLTEDGDSEESTKLPSIKSRSSSRKNSIGFRQDTLFADDTFENILQVTSHHDAIMAFYYMDDNNKVKVTEIFEVTEADGICSDDGNSEIMQDWDEPLASASWLNAPTETGSDNYFGEDEKSLTDDTTTDDLEAANIFSDPESEWIHHGIDYNQRQNTFSDLRPESEQIVLHPAELN